MSHFIPNFSMGASRCFLFLFSGLRFYVLYVSFHSKLQYGCISMFSFSFFWSSFLRVVCLISFQTSVWVHLDVFFFFFLVFVFTCCMSHFIPNFSMGASRCFLFLFSGLRF